MSAPALVLDVVPPPDLPPIRVRRDRGWSVFLVAVCLGLVSVLGLTPSARAVGPALLVPVAKGIGATAASVLTAEAFEAMWNGDGDKPADDDDSDAAKKGRGKWGDRLKGLLDITPGVLGALFGIDGAFGDEDQGEGVELPDDFAADVGAVADEVTGGKGGTYSTWYIKSVDWNIRETSGVSYDTFRFNGTCSGYDGFCKPADSLSDFRFTIKCHTPGVGYWDMTRTFAINRTPITQAGLGMCRKAGSDPEGQVHSVTISPTTTGSVNKGIAEFGVYYNPEFRLEDDPAAGGSITAEVKCRLADGTIQTLSKTVAGTDVMPLISCPDGAVPESIGWTGTNAGKSEWLGGVETKTPASYPECAPGSCTRVITVDGAPCFVGRQECYDWMRTEPPSRVKCEYGPYNMPLAECADLENIHKSTWGVTPETDPNRERKLVPANPDGTPDRTRTGTEYLPEDNPNPEYRPPARGPVVTAPPQTGPTTTPTAPPSSTPPAVPPPVWNPPVPGVPDLENPTKNCIAGMASWNPVHWVFVPVKCALTWAFVPKNDAGAAAFQQFRQKFTDSGMGPWLAIPPMLFDDLPEGSGCQGPPLTMPEMLGGKTYYPLNACSDPMAKYANMSRSLITVVVVFYGMFSVVNSLTTSLTGYRMFERESVDVGKKL